MAKPIINNGEGERLQVMTDTVTVLASGADTDGQYETFLVESRGGNAQVKPPLHQHPWAETFSVLGGEVEFTLGREVQTLSAGGFVNVPGDVPHVFRVVNPTSRMLVMTTGATASAFFRAMSQEVSFPPDMGLVMGLAARFGITISRPAQNA